MKEIKLNYQPIKQLPVAKFYYKGTHSHPVRRTILLIETKANFIRGYELREGSKVRNLNKAPIKSYNRGKISKYSNLGKANHKEPGPEKSTLERMTLLELLHNGI